MVEKSNQVILLANNIYTVHFWNISADSFKTDAQPTRYFNLCYCDGVIHSQSCKPWIYKQFVEPDS